MSAVNLKQEAVWLVIPLFTKVDNEWILVLEDAEEVLGLLVLDHSNFFGHSFQLVVKFDGEQSAGSFSG